MILIKSLIISTLCLLGFSFFVKISLDQNLLHSNEKFTRVSSLESGTQKLNIFSGNNLTINKFQENDLSYLDVIFEKGNLKLMPDYIPFIEDNNLKILSNSKIVSLHNSKLNFFMLLDSNVYRFSLNMLSNNFILFIGIVGLILVMCKAIFITSFYFKFSNLVVSVCLLIVTLLISNFVDSINNFKVLAIQSKVGDKIDSRLVRYSILAIPSEKANYSLILNSKIENVPLNRDNVLLFNFVAGPDNFIYINQSKLFAQQALINNLNIPMPYKQEINSVYNPGKERTSNLEYKIINSKFVTLKLNTDLGGKRGFYFPVLRNQIVFPKFDQNLVSQFNYNLVVYTKLDSLNFIKNILLFLCVIQFFYIIRLVKNAK